MPEARSLCWLIVMTLLVGCQTTSAAPQNVAPQQTTPSHLDATQHGFSADYPDGWKSISKGGDFVLAAVPKAASGSDTDPTIAIEVPKLPFHIPGMIPLGGVADGYVKDLKKRYPDQKVDEKSNVQIDGADARRFVSSFQNNGKPWRELAVLTIHGDHVYVVTGNCDATSFDKTKDAFNALTASMKWTQKS